MSRFDSGSMIRIAKQIRAAERRPQSTAIGPRRVSKTANVRPGMLAVTTTVITARSGVSPHFTLGSGTALLLWTENGVTSSSGQSVTIRNLLTTTIAAGVLVKLAFVDSNLIADLADCP